jgi:hypothetical protein
LTDARSSVDDNHSRALPECRHEERRVVVVVVVVF